VLGIAVLATVFASHGGYSTVHTMTTGVRAASYVGVAMLGVGALVTLIIPSRRRSGTALPSATSLEHDLALLTLVEGPTEAVAAATR